MRWPAVSVAVLAVACTGASVPDRRPPSFVAEPAAVSSASPEAGPPATPPAVTLPEPNLDAIAEPDVRAAIAEAVAEARAVLGSETFRRHLVRVEHLDAHSGSYATTGAAVATLYLGLDGVAHQLPTTYLADERSCKENVATTKLNGPARQATTKLHACIVERAKGAPRSRSEPAEKLGCAINTIAHEWTHTIPDLDRGGKVALYQDKGHRDVTEGLVSYTVGAIAQCAYLESRGYRVEERFDECVQLVGTTVFHPKTCATGRTARDAADGADAGAEKGRAEKGPEKGWAERTFGHRVPAE